ncbi:hypothetical protein LINPERPRIM_LOCUS27224 [Linum perenne]
MWCFSTKKSWGCSSSRPFF